MVSLLAICAINGNMMKFQSRHSTELSISHSRLMESLESLKNEADHRSLGGFQTEDLRFANQTADIVRDVISFLDFLEDEIQEFNSHCEIKNKNLQDEIIELEGKIYDLEEDNYSLKEKIDEISHLKRMIREVLLDD